ncbi:DTW domain protein [Marinomonas gallaica]|uniref:tRNA-uridine aminocarboxypropyltransferase n=1 Tax=Marinomonas gallaica TaxID=1806667 RepID=A0A1C3JS61_9GAMM|nr:tRNA-uridine aminocarboxypropyltransferase [Marinomonas gallaica]SBT18053.1 DTW domain protein [Marinomonas gallaica]SBT19839.1 DTW domain protein [Marinomonas gallaica]
MTSPSSKRVTCLHCGYPLGQCVCHLIVSLEGDMTVWVIQDKHEAKHAKNTARLLALCYLKTVIVSFEDAEEMSNFFQSVDADNSLLLYPSGCSEGLETIEQSDKAKVKHLILLDGTWPKAKRMMLLESMLLRYRQVHFLTPPVSKYDIRKSPNNLALSTFEAAAYGLECLGMLQISKLRHFFSAAIALQWSQQPQEHKQRS